MAQTKMAKMIEGLQKHGVAVKTDVPRIEEARFSLDANGKGTLQIPEATSFRDLNHQVSSVMQGVSHANIAREAQRVVAAAPRVAAYQQPPSKQAKSAAFAEADLVASYAALHETTGLGANYDPSPNVRNVEMQERWAAKLAEPGGYASVDRQITRTLVLDKELSPPRTQSRFKTREQLSQPEHAGRSQQDVSARAAAALRHERRSAGDDSVPPPPERPGSATQTQAAARTQTKGQEAPTKPAR